MQNLCCAERFGVQPADFLELECRFLRDSEPDAARQNVQVSDKPAMGFHRRGPVTLPRFVEEGGRAPQFPLQCVLSTPATREVHERSQRCDKRLGCRDADFVTGTQRQ